MPDAGEHPHNEDVPVGFQQTFPVAAQGDIYIFPEPGAEGDVPAPPEFGDAPGDIGVVEVDFEFEAQHPP